MNRTPIQKLLPSGQRVQLRGKASPPRRARHSRFAAAGLSYAMASAFSAAGASISQAITGLSITLAGLATAQAQSEAQKANLPQGRVEVLGTATPVYSGKNLTVTTTNGVVNGVNTGRSITNWESFNIGKGYTTHIDQPNSQSSSLNRVITHVPSQIYGTLRSNGQVILVNQNGIAVGAGGVVDTAGFTASTLNITDADYKAKRLRFEGNALSGGVLIEGEDRSDPNNIRPGAVLRSSNGDVMLFAPNVTVGKDAKVKADSGNVIVGAGQSVEVTGRGLEGVKFIIQSADNKAMNLGTLQGNAVGVFAGTLRHSGVIQAQTATMEGGRVVLRAVKEVEIVKDASLAKAPVIEANGGVNAAGAAQKGGTIQIESVQGNVTIGAGSAISANAANLSLNQSSAGMNAVGGAIDIIASKGGVITEVGSSIRAIGSPGGTIRIVGGQEARVASIVDVSSPNRGAADAVGALQLITVQDVGGTIQILSPQIVDLHTGAQLLANGDAGGGTILVGGDYQGASEAIVNAQNTNVSQGVLLEANARVNGNGGKVIVWADNDTHFAGTLHAKGGEQGGDGGFGETSGKKNLYFRGRADLSARRGRSGTLYLDPETITINGGSGTSDDGASDGINTSADEGGNLLTTYTIYEADIESLGATANVILEAARNINFQGTFTNDDLAVSKNLTLTTRNAATDSTLAGGVSLGGWGNSSFTISAGGSLNIKAGTGYTGLAATAPVVFSNTGAVLLLQSGAASGDVTVEAAGLVQLGKGTTLNSPNGQVNVRSTLSDVTLGWGSTSSAMTVTGKSVAIQAQSAGALIDLQNAATVGATGSGGVLLEADRLTIDPSSTIVSSAGSIDVRPYTNSRQILLGGTNDLLIATSLQISQTEFDRFNANTALRFGNTLSHTGGIEIGGLSAFNFGSGSVALLTNGGSITQTQGLSSNSLRLSAGSINLNQSANSFYQLTAKSTLGSINIASGGSLSLSTVDGQSGLSSASSITVSDTSISGSKVLNLEVGNDITAEGNINIQAFETLMVYSGNYTIDSNTDNLGNSGNISIDTNSTILASTTNRGLTLNSATGQSGFSGGAISFSNVLLNGSSEALEDILINSSAPALNNYGSIALPSTLKVGSGGATITGRVMLNNAAWVDASGTGTITFNGEIQQNNTLSLNSDSGNITLNAVAGNGTNVGTVDIFSTTGTVNLNNNITTSAGTNINVVGSSVNVGNSAQLRAGNLIYIGTNSNASANTINIATGSQLFAQVGNLTLSAEDNIFINANVGGYGDVNIVSSAGSVSMNNLINVTGYQTTGSLGTKSMAIHGQTGVTLAHVNANTVYNATVTTGAGQTIASAGSITNLAAFNDIFLGSSTTVRSNIGFSGAPIRFGSMNGITAYGDLNLYLLAQTGGANLNITNASVDTGTSSIANAEIISNGNLSVNTFSVAGTGTAHLDFRASQNTHITGTVTGNANSDMVLAADEFLILGALPNSIASFHHVGLQGRSNNQHIRFIDTIGSAIAGTTQITYAQNQYLANSVGHVVVGKTANGGNIEFTGTGSLNPSTLTSARNYSFLAGGATGSISTSANRTFDLDSVGFSAAGNIDLGNVNLNNSNSGQGLTIAARSTAGAINLKTNDAQGVTVGTVGAATGASVVGLQAAAGNNADLENTLGNITAAADVSAGVRAGLKANGTVTINNAVTMSGSGSGSAGLDLAVLIEADDLVLNGTLDANGKDIGMARYNPGRALTLGGNTGTGFVLSGAELANLTDYRDLALGTTSFGWGDVTVTGAFNLGAHGLHIETDSAYNISQNAVGVITASSLSVVGGDISLNAAMNSVSSFTARHIGSSGDLEFLADGSFAIGVDGVRATLSSSGNISLTSQNGAITNPNAGTIKSSSGNIRIESFTGIGSLANRIITQTSGSVEFSLINSGDIYAESVGHMNLAGFSTSGTTSIVNIFSPNNLTLTANSVTNDQITLNSGGGILDFGSGSITGASANLSGNQGIVSGTAARDVDVSGSLAMFSNGSLGNIGSSAAPISARANTFSINTTGANSPNGNVYLNLESASGSTFNTSAIGLNIGGSAPVVRLSNVAATPAININSNIMTGLNYGLTLDAAGGSIEVNQPNAVSSGTSNLTLIADSTRINTITTVNNQVNVITGDGTVSSGAGVLRGNGIWNNAGKMLLNEGTIAPGVSGIGTLSVNGSVSMGSSGTLDVDIGTTATNGDRLIVGANFIAGGSLRVNEFDLSSTVAGTPYTVATVGGTYAPNFANVTSSTGSFTAAGGSAITVTASSLTNKWINNASGFWGTAGANANWSRGITPTAAHDVWIDVVGFNPTVTASSAAVANSLHVGDTLTLNASLGVTGGMTVLNGGTFNHTNGASGTITAGGNITIDVGGVMNWAGGQIGLVTDTTQQFNSNGTINITGPGSSYQDIYRHWNNSGVINWTGGRFTELVANANGNIIFTNYASGQINLNSVLTNTTDDFLGNATGRFDNLGLITVNTSATNLITGINRSTGSSFRNQGSVNVIDGSVQVGTAGVLANDTGSYTVAAGENLNFISSRTLASGASIAGTGKLSITGGTVEIGNGVSVNPLANGQLNVQANLNLFTGNLQTVADLTLGSVGKITTGDGLSIASLSSAGGTFAGSGVYSTTGNSSITGTLTRDGGDWSNSGVMNVSASGSLRLTGSSTLTNAAGGQMNYVDAGSDAVFVSTGTNRFINQGTFSLGAGTTARAIGVAFDNSGVVNINAGQLTLSNTSSGTESGVYNVAGGTTLQVGGSRQFTSLAAGAGLFGTGVLDVQNAAQVTLSNGVNTDLLQNGTVKVAGSGLTLNTGSGFTFANTVQLLGSGTINHANAMTGAFTANGSGLITSPSMGTVWTLPTSTTSTLSLAAGTFSTTNTVLENLGIFNFNGNGALSLGNSLTNQGIVNLSADGSIGGVGTFNNTISGIVNRTTSANTFSINSGFAQGGTLNANSGTLAFTNAISNSGLIQGTARLNVGGAGLTNGSAGMIAPGSIGTVGTLTLGGNLISSIGSRLLIDATSASTYDRLNVTANFNSVSGATISVAEATPFLAVNDQLDAVSYTGTFSGSLPTMVSPLGITLTASTTASSNGFLRLTTSAVSNFWKDIYSDTNYANTANWSRGHVPTVAEDAIINTSTGAVAVTLSSGTQTPRSLQLTGDDSLLLSSSTLTIGQASTVANAASLLLSGGLLDGAGSLDVAGSLSLSNGTISGSGTLGTSLGSTSNITVGSTVNRDWNNAGAIDFTGGSSFLTMNGSLNNQSSGVINMSSTYNGAVISLLTANTAFNNAGTVHWNSGAAATSIITGTTNTTFNNSGQFNISGSSKVNLPIGGTDIGDYSVLGGSTLSFTGGSRNLNTGSDITGGGLFVNAGATTNIQDQFGVANTGVVRVTSGTLTLQSTVAAPDFMSPLDLTGGTLALNMASVNFDVPVNILGATLTGAADFVFTTGGSLTLQTAVLSGTGTLGTPSGVTTSINTSGSTVNRNWTNAGTIDLTGASSFLAMNGDLTNQASGVINMTSGYNGMPITLGTANTTFSNVGQINWNSGSLVDSGITGTTNTSFHNSGQFDILGNSKVRVFIGGTDTGDYNVLAGSTLAFAGGTRNLNSGSDITGSGVFLNSGATTTINDAFSIGNTGTLAVSNGTLTLASTVAAPNFNAQINMTGGTLVLNTSDVAFDVPVSLLNAALNGSADFDFVAGSSLTLNNSSIGSTGTLGTAAGISTSIFANSTVNRDWINAGTINMSGGSTRLTQFGNLTNQASGEINMNSSFAGNVINLLTGSASFNNEGTINWNSGVNSILTGTSGTGFNNSGQLNIVGNSQLTLSVPNLNQTGTIDIASGSTLTRSAGIANAGLLRGGGSVNVGSSSLTSAGGTIAPGGVGVIATLTIAGNADLSSGTLLFDLGSAGTSDRLAISGSATLGAPLSLSELTTGAADMGDGFTLITYASKTGTSGLDNSAIADVGFTANVGATSYLASVNAVTNRWSETAATTNWHTAANWTRGHVPTALEDVVIDVSSVVGKQVEASSAAAVRSITLSGDDDLVMNGATLTIGNASASTLSSGATVTLTGGRLMQSAAGGTLDISGRIESTGSSDITVSNINNAGVVRVNSGTLSLQGGGADTAGNYTVDSGARLSLLSGQRTFGTTTTLNGPGTLGLDGAKLTISQISANLPLFAAGTVDVAAGELHISGVPAVINHLELASGGTISSAGSSDHVMIVDAFHSTGGKISGPGTLYTNPGSSSTVQGVLTLDNTTWENSGDITFTAVGQFDAIALANGSAFNNMNGGIVIGNDLRQFMVFEGATLGSGSAVHNSGYMEFNALSVSETVFMDVSSFTNSITGTVRLGNGANFVMTPTVFNQGGTLTIANNSTLGILTLNNSGLIEGNGTINLASGTMTHTGTLRPGDVDGSTGLGTLSITGHLLLDQGSHIYFDLDPGNSDKITVSGNITLTGASGPSFNFSEFNPNGFSGLEAAQTVMTAGGSFTGLPSQYTWSNLSSDINFTANAEFANQRLTASVANIRNSWLTAAPAGDDWFTPGNWSRNAVPNQWHDVTIDTAGPNRVDITTANATARSIVLGSASNTDNTLYINGKSLTVSDPNSSSGLRFDLYADNTLNIVGGGTLALGGGDFNIQSNAIVKGVGFTLSADSGSLGNASIYNDGTIINTGGQSTLGQSSGARTVSIENTSSGMIDTGAGGGGITIAAASFDQNGLMITRSNRIRVTGGDFTNGSMGRVLLAGGTLDAGINNIINNGKIDGTGTLTAGTVENHGTLAPGSIASAGSLLIDGNFINASSGTLSIRGFSPVSNDSLQVAGNVDLDGTLNLIASGTHAYAGGQSYQVIQSTNTPTGGFATVSGIGVLIANQNSTSSGQFVTLANPAGSIEWIGGDGDWDVASNWDLNRLPQSGDTVIINPTGAKTIFVDSGTDLSVLSFSASSGDDTLLIISGGSLGVQSGATLDGTLHVNGGILDILGTNTAAQLTISNGQANLSGGNLSIGTLALNGGQLFIGTGHTASLTTTGTWGGSSSIVSPIGSPGTLAVGANVPFEISGFGTRTLDAVALNNAGTLWVGLGSGTGGTLAVNNGAVITNSNSGSLISMLNSGNQTLHTATGTGTVINAGGHLEARSASALVIDTSSLSVAGGSYNAPGVGIFFEADSNSISGALGVSAGKLTLGEGSHVLASGASVSGAGMLWADDLATSITLNNFTVNSDFTVEGAVTIAAGQQVTVASGANMSLYASLNGTGSLLNQGVVHTGGAGTLVISPDVTNEGVFNINAPTVRFDGALTLPVSSDLRLLMANSTVQRNAGMVNSGNISSNGDATLNVGTGGYSGIGTLSPGGTGPVATLTIAGDADFTPANLRFDLQNSSTYDKINVTGQATVGASTIVKIDESGSAFVGSGDSFDLLQSTGLLGSAPVLVSGMTDVTFTAAMPGNNLLANVSSVTNRWNTDSSGSWATVANWSRGHAPRAAEDVVLDRSSANPTVTIDTGVTAFAQSIDFGIGANDNLSLTGTGVLNLGAGGMTVPQNSILSMQGQAINTEGTIELYGVMNWGAGTIDGVASSKSLNVGVTGNLSISTTPGVTIGNNLQISNSGYMYWDGGQITLNGQIVVNNGATFTSQTSSNLTDKIVGPGSILIDNGASMIVQGGATELSIDAIFVNDGTVNITGPNLALNKGTTHSGTFQIASSKKLIFAGTGQATSLTSSSSVQGLGSVELNTAGGRLDVEGAYSVASTKVLDGELALQDVNATGDIQLIGGQVTFAGTGATSVSSLVVSGGAVVVEQNSNLVHSSWSGGTLEILSSKTLTSAGAMVLAGSVDGSASAGVLRNGATGTLSGAGVLGVGSGMYQNLGTISPGTGAAGIAAITIAGDADLTLGTLDIGLQNLSTYDKLAVQGDLAGGGTVKLTHTSTPFVAVGDSFQPLSYSGTLASSTLGIDSTTISGVAFTTTNASTTNSAFTLTAGALGGIFWDGGGDGINWSDPINWSTNALPTVGQNVTINPSGNSSVTLASGSVAGLTGLTLDASDGLFITGGSLALPGTNLFLNGTVNLAGGTILGDSAGGTFNNAFNWSGGTFAGTGAYIASSLSLAGGGARVFAMTGSGSLNASTFTTTLADGKLSLQSGDFIAGTKMVVASGSTLAFDGGQLTAALFTNQGQTRINSGNVALPAQGAQSGGFVISSGANLEFSKDATLTSSASVVGGSWTIANGKTVMALGSLNRGSGSITTVDVNSKLNMTGDLETDELILHSGASVTGAGGALKVNTGFDTFITANPITGFGSATLTQASGDLVLNQDLSVSGALNLTATTARILGNGNTVQGGNLFAVAQNDIDLKVINTPTLGAISTAGNIDLDVTGNTVFSALSTTAGKIATVTSNGTVGQSAAISTDGRVVVALGTNDLAWQAIPNSIAQGIHVLSADQVVLISNPATPLIVSGNANEFQLGGGAIQLGSTQGTLNVSGPLTVQASANITQGATLNITGLTDLSTTGGDIILPTASTYTSDVKFSAPLGSAQFNSNGAISLRGNAGNDLTVQASGNVTQPGVAAASLTVGGNALINAASFDVTLNNTGNDFGGLSVIGNNLVAVDKNGLNLGGTLVGDVQVYFAGNLNSGTLGTLSASSLYAENSAPNVSVNLSASVAGLTTFTGSADYASITYSNAALGTYTDLIANASIQLTQSGALDLPYVSAPTASISATGAVTQSGSIEVTNFGVVALGQDIQLTDSGNLINQFSAQGQNVQLVSAQTVDPNILATGSVSITALGISQSVGNAISSVAFDANVTGGLGLFGTNNLGSLTATAGADMDIRNGAAPLQLGNLQASGMSGISLTATGPVSQMAGTSLQASKANLTGGSLGSSSAPIEVEVAQMSFNATNGSAYIRNNQTSELLGMQATSTANYSSTADVQVMGNASAANVQIFTTGALDIGNPGSAVQLFASNSMELEGSGIAIKGGTSAEASAKVISLGGLRVNTAGHFVMQGGSQSNTFAEIFAAGPVSVTAASSVLVVGGSGTGAYARLDPALGSLLTINSGVVDVQGGTGAGAYGAIVSEGDIIINAASLSLVEGSGLDADAVVISQFGRISAPNSCNGCLDLSSMPLGNGSTGTGLYSGGQILAQSNNTALLTSQLLQIETLIETLTTEPEREEDKREQPDIVVEGQICP